MSLKGVELQVAIPKTVDAGKIVEQHQQNVIQQQLNANEALKKDIERKQLTVNDSEPPEKITEEESRKSGERNNKSNKKKSIMKKKEKVNHPYKGNFIDFSG